MSRLSIMPHAIERYRERWAPHLTSKQAREELLILSEGARPEKTRTRGGQELWVANDKTRKILFVVKRDRRTRERICVTVLPEGAMENVAAAEEYGEFLTYQEERAEMLHEMEMMRARDDGLECQGCNNATATKFSVKRKQRFCEACIRAIQTNPHAGSVGRCILIDEWTKKPPEEQREILGEETKKSEPKPVIQKQPKAAISALERPEARAAEVFKRLYSACAWFVDVQPASLPSGKKYLLVSVNRMLESHESRFLRDFMGLPVRLDVLGVGELHVRQASKPDR
jgi:hypothetical protein